MFTLAANNRDNIYTFGLNNYGQLGDGTRNDRTIPVVVYFGGSKERTKKLVAGYQTSILLLQSGKVIRWGYINSAPTSFECTAAYIVTNIYSVSDREYYLTSSGESFTYFYNSNRCTKGSWIEFYPIAVTLNNLGLVYIYRQANSSYMITTTRRQYKIEPFQPFKQLILDALDYKVDWQYSLFMLSQNGKIYMQSLSDSSTWQVNITDLPYTVLSIDSGGYIGANDNDVNRFAIVETCEPYYSGPNCSIIECNGKRTGDPGLCRDLGVCIAPNLCSCIFTFLYEGSDCEKPSLYMLLIAILTPILSLLIIFGFSFATITFCLRCKNMKQGAFIELVDDALIDYKHKLLYEEDTPLQNVVMDVIKQTDTYFANYEDITFIDRIGSGQFGVVFRGRYNSTQAAIKMLQLDNHSSQQDFRKEALVLARIHHPHCVLFMGISVHEGYCYIITELMDQSLHSAIFRTNSGGELSSDILVNHKYIPFNTKINILLQISEAMIYLHSKGMVHYDLKPANCLMDVSMTKTKVCDFGTAQFTKVKFTGGTPEYLAPEKIVSEYEIEGREEKCDIYSFAIIMYELFFTRHAYPYVTEKLLDQVAHERLRPQIPSIQYIEEEMTNVERMYMNLMTKCWRHAPEHRPSFKQIHEELEKIQT